MLFILTLFSCQGEPCNGDHRLCERTVDKVSFPSTHNSMSSSERDWIPPNHLYAVPTQLKDGIRGLNFDTYIWEEEPALCHTFCELGTQPLSDGLKEVEEFLVEQPRNVILITFQSAISAEETMLSMEESGLKKRLYHHETGQEWPTLSELIEEEKQIVAFSNSGGGEHNGYMSQWTHWVDSPYAAQSPEDFKCEPDRGDPETASLYNVNHFISNPIALPEYAEEANNSPVMRNHVMRCKEETGLLPNMILVDFYSIGELMPLVRELNEVDD